MSGSVLAIAVKMDGNGRSIRWRYTVRTHPTTTHFFNVLTVCSALCLGAAGCAGKSSAFPLSLQEVRQMSPINSTHISFEERGGEIFVSVIDKSGDSHIHKLEFGAVSKQQALDILKQKQIELEAPR